ncbi:MAG: M50 family metallopeptidase [Pirellulales bacterium]|nr:M50 family metallopeptidase [Pirellulales bacterium]
MLFIEPPPTPYDLRFKLGSLPVRVHPMFWLVAVLLGIRAKDPKLVALWVGVVFVSILVHELGHALAARACGWYPRIVLHAMGGLAIYQPTYRSRAKQMMVTAAGPLAGFILAALLVLVLLASDHVADIFGFEIGNGKNISNPYLRFAVRQALWLNIVWGLVNCLPILPLDGGQFVREIFTGVNPRDGMLWSFQLSMLVAALVAVAGMLFLNDFFIALFFGYLAYSSYLGMSSLQGNRFGGW